uniref:Enoyl reductase (ER) domain-containing protein n=1 Tax=Noctiluca scintillans TaxID=2966 RepID=A0A7S1AGM9_NOCSC|mmetsp:Transcript_45517/g.120775  ORF Transcript_45517/g.120775 Transcript_45517/m.120775 type:complete len:376 (+) Transcript_45517:50-1177(+)|eukprot:CAMPEP_0194505782 /NCGR_PEP_ID=MMETSP0253-20130528/33023_1 /TAXON_ID=2966 /ORGANISM="Noctiluca scintillans" /LENGTH=375 /DNA_ID=CAMNT_0039348397 /DNA_START=21 /DNA_END=1148 /DNA_ORIENTATION=-
MPLQLRTLIQPEGQLELSLAEVPLVEPKPDEIVVRVDAAPINPSDLALVFGPADVSTLRRSDQSAQADIPASAMKFVAGRVSQSLPCGNEGAGLVVKAGSSPEAQALLGKMVGIVGGATYGQYRTLRSGMCLAFPEGVTAADAASWFVNPMTALGMVETMRNGGHKALVHTAAASNLGQMLIKICLQDGIELVNIVRRQQQADLLKSIGAKHVVSSESPSFLSDLTEALVATGATIAFDAIGGGKLAGQILSCMEMAATKNATEYSRYGSDVHKQVYIYGGLDRSPTTLNRTFGLNWSLGGWLLTPFLQNAGPEVRQRLRARVAAEIKTTFASTYTKRITLNEFFDVDVVREVSKMATGEKFLLEPNKDIQPSKL